MERIPTARPSWTDEMREAAVSTLDSRHWVKGPKGREFGKKFADYCGALVATPCQNGSSSLWAALRILGVGKGDRVWVGLPNEDLDAGVGDAQGQHGGK